MTFPATAEPPTAEKEIVEGFENLLRHAAGETVVPLKDHGWVNGSMHGSAPDPNPLPDPPGEPIPLPQPAPTVAPTPTVFTL